MTDSGGGVPVQRSARSNPWIRAVNSSARRAASAAAAWSPVARARSASAASAAALVGSPPRELDLPLDAAGLPDPHRVRDPPGRGPPRLEHLLGLVQVAA